MITDDIAAINTEPAAISLASLMRGSFSLETLSHNLSMAEFTISKAITKLIQRIRNIHSVFDIRKEKPKKVTSTTASRCSFKCSSCEIDFEIPLIAAPNESICFLNHFILYLVSS